MPVAPKPPEGISPIALTPPPVVPVTELVPPPVPLKPALPPPEDSTAMSEAAPAATLVSPTTGSAAAIQPPTLSPVLPPQPAIQSLIWQLCNSQRTPGQTFHLVVTRADQQPVLETFATCELLIARMAELLGSECYLFAFLGHHLGLTGGPLHHLQTPWGFVPLFSAPTAEQLQLLPNGWVGKAAPVESYVAKVQEENPDQAPTGDADAAPREADADRTETFGLV